MTFGRTRDAQGKTRIIDGLKSSIAISNMFQKEIWKLQGESRTYFQGSPVSQSARQSGHVLLFDNHEVKQSL